MDLVARFIREYRATIAADAEYCRQTRLADEDELLDVASIFRVPRDTEGCRAQTQDGDSGNVDRCILHSHQCRVGYRRLEEMARRLKTSPRRAEISRQTRFDELHSLLVELVGGIDRIGPLTVYDTAVRIAAGLGFEPDEVYLHCGALEGALALLGNLPSPVKKDVFPPEIRDRLSPHEIEVFLCVCKGSLKELMRKP